MSTSLPDNSPLSSPSHTLVSDAEYRRLTDAVFSSIEATIDGWLDGDWIDIDAHRVGGLLELLMPNGSQLVINTQPPLQELWLAARSGGYHFRWCDDCWRDTKDNKEFFERLSGCASEQAGRRLTFTASA